MSSSQHSGTELIEFGHSLERSETGEESGGMKEGIRQQYREKPGEKGFDRMLQFAFVTGTLETPPETRLKHKMKHCGKEGFVLDGYFV